MLSKGGIGGGDVKLMAAVGFLLGPSGAVGGAFIGFTLFIIVWLLFYRTKQSKAYAMAPYLGIGCFLAYILKL
jgi:leader peptidase (prepilin peptidase)/N-methyltransferase